MVPADASALHERSVTTTVRSNVHSLFEMLREITRINCVLYTIGREQDLLSENGLDGGPLPAGPAIHL